jgi:hypothetical protein
LSGSVLCKKTRIIDRHSLQARKQENCPCLAPHYILPVRKINLFRAGGAAAVNILIIAN